jgi:hypothetical protein
MISDEDELLMTSEDDTLLTLLLIEAEELENGFEMEEVSAKHDDKKSAPPINSSLRYDNLSFTCKTSLKR